MRISIQHRMEHIIHIQLRTDEPEDGGGAGTGAGPGVGTGTGAGPGVGTGTGPGACESHPETKAQVNIDVGHPGSTCAGTETPFTQVGQ